MRYQTGDPIFTCRLEKLVQENFSKALSLVGFAYLENIPIGQAGIGQSIFLLLWGIVWHQASIKASTQ